MLGEHAAHDVPVDVDAERARDDTHDPWATEPRIAWLELGDGADELLRSDPLGRAFSDASAPRRGGDTCDVPTPHEVPRASRGA